MTQIRNAETVKQEAQQQQQRLGQLMAQVTANRAIIDNPDTSSLIRAQLKQQNELLSVAMNEERAKLDGLRNEAKHRAAVEAKIAARNEATEQKAAAAAAIANVSF